MLPPIRSVSQPQIAIVQDQFQTAVRALLLYDANWDDPRWAALFPFITQTYLDSVFEYESEIADLFQLVKIGHPQPFLDMDRIERQIALDPRLSRMPRIDALHLLTRHPHYRYQMRPHPKQICRVEEKYLYERDKLSRGESPNYFSVLSDFLAFRILLRNPNELPYLIQRIQTIVESREGFVFVRYRNRTDPFVDGLVKFAHVYLPKYGLIEFQILCFSQEEGDSKEQPLR